MKRTCWKVCEEAPLFKPSLPLLLESACLWAVLSEIMKLIFFSFFGSGKTLHPIVRPVEKYPIPRIAKTDNGLSWFSLIIFYFERIQNTNTKNYLVISHCSYRYFSITNTLPFHELCFWNLPLLFLHKLDIFIIDVYL